MVSLRHLSECPVRSLCRGPKTCAASDGHALPACAERHQALSATPASPLPRLRKEELAQLHCSGSAPSLLAPLRQQRKICKHDIEIMRPHCAALVSGAVDLQPADP